MNTFPLGIAAGMIKQAAHVDTGLLDLVHSIAFGSFTVEARSGNPEPTFWFNERTEGSINAVGLKNPGLQHFLDIELPILEPMFKGRQCKIVVSLAPLKAGDLGIMTSMILRCPRRHLIHRVEVNAACPNHRDGDNLHPVLAHDPVAVRLLLEELFPDDLSCALKIAPNTSEETLEEIVNLCSDFDSFAILSGNTERGSSVIDGEQRLSVEQGGLAGLPLLKSAVAQVETLSRITQMIEHRRPIIIGCGGIMNAGGMAKHKLAGADEVQVATLYYRYGVDAVQDILQQYYSDE